MFLLSGSSFICSLWIVSFPRMISERETKGRKADECFSWEYARYSDSRRPNQTGMTSHLKKKKKMVYSTHPGNLFFAQAQHTDNHFLDMSPCCSGLSRKLYENADQVSLNHYMTLLLALVIDSALSMDFFFNSTTNLIYIWLFYLLYIFFYNFIWPVHFWKSCNKCLYLHFFLMSNSLGLHRLSKFMT